MLNMIGEPRCFVRDCIHFVGIRSEGIEKNERPVCKAFPDGIPDEIAYGDNNHTEPFLGDNGIRFKRKKIT